MLFSFFYDCFDYINVFLRKFAVLIKFLVCIDMLPPRHNPLRQQKSRKIMRLSHHRQKKKIHPTEQRVGDREKPGRFPRFSQPIFLPACGWVLLNRNIIIGDCPGVSSMAYTGTKALRNIVFSCRPAVFLVLSLQSSPL